VAFVILEKIGGLPLGLQLPPDQLFESKLQNHKAVRNYEPQIQLIANGADMWDRSFPKEELRAYRKAFLFKMAGQPTNTQMTERSVKKSNNVVVCNRNEQTRSAYAMANHSQDYNGLPQSP